MNRAVIRVGTETIEYSDGGIAAIDFAGFRDALDKAVATGCVGAHAINEADGGYRYFLLSAGVPVSLHIDGPISDRVHRILSDNMS